MAIVPINVGNAANDGTGDDLREAFIKINQNFQNLDTIAEQTGANLGSSGAAVFSNITNNTFYFRRLVAGNNLQITQLDNTIVFDNTMPESRFTVTTDAGSLIGGAGINYNIIGAEGTTVSASENTKTIVITGSLVQDTTPVLGGNLDANNKNISNVNSLTANNLTATNVILTTINGLNYQDKLGKYLDGFDLGEINQTPTSLLEWVVLQTGFDFGSIPTPSPGNVDLGSIV